MRICLKLLGVCEKLNKKTAVAAMQQCGQDSGAMLESKRCLSVYTSCNTDHFVLFNFFVDFQPANADVLSLICSARQSYVLLASH